MKLLIIKKRKLVGHFNQKTKFKHFNKYDPNKLAKLQITSHVSRTSTVKPIMLS